jgi:hypothetical protein
MMAMAMALAIVGMMAIAVIMPVGIAVGVMGIEGEEMTAPPHDKQTQAKQAAQGYFEHAWFSFLT